MALVTRLRSRIPDYPRMIWILAVGSFLNIAGLSFLWPINQIYIHDYLGKPLTVAGVVLMLTSAGGAVGQLMGGWLYDRIGARPVLLTGLALAAAAISIPVWTDSWPLYLVAMTLFGCLGGVSFPVVNALAARAWPRGGRRAFNFIYVANNLGVAFGTALGGVVAERSFKLAFAATAIMLVCYLLFAARFIHEAAPVAEVEATPATLVPEAEITAEFQAPWAPILALFFSMVTYWIIYVQWQGAVAVHMRAVGFQLSAYSMLWTLNGLLIFAAQPLLTLTLRRFRSTASQLWLGGVLFAGSFAVFLWSDRYTAFVASMVFLSLGEMLLWPGIPAAVARLSPPSRRGFFQGFIGSGTTAGRMLGPLLGGIAYDQLGFNALVMIAIVSMVVPSVGVALYARKIPADLAADPAD